MHFCRPEKGTICTFLSIKNRFFMFSGFSEKAYSSYISPAYNMILTFSLTQQGKKVKEPKNLGPSPTRMNQTPSCCQRIVLISNFQPFVNEVIKLCNFIGQQCTLVCVNFQMCPYFSKVSTFRYYPFYMRSRYSSLLCY